MKIAPLSLLKTGASAKIVDFVDNGNPEEAHQLNRYLISLGFYSGQDIKLLRKTGTVLQVRSGTDNPFAMDIDVANTIRIIAQDGDVFESVKAQKKAESLSANLKHFFDKLKNRSEK
jgi:Fe2+ transport system protein FeoA